MKVAFRKIALGTLAAFALVAAVPAESFAQSRHWHGHHRHWAGPAAAAGIVGAVALGALAASAYTYGSHPGGCVWRKQRTYDAWGRFVGYQPVQVCY